MSTAADETGDQIDRGVRWRRMDELIAERAPFPVRRAASVLVAIGRELQRLERDGIVYGEVRSEHVMLGDDGSVRLIQPGLARSGPPLDPEDTEGSAAGASLGRLLFEAMVSRPPLRRDDAYEPVIIEQLGRNGVTLMARSCSRAPGQWPTVTQWTDALEALAGGLAPPLPPALRRRARRRRLVLALAVLLLLAITVVVIALAPSWWNAANDDGAIETAHSATSPTQASRAVS